MPFNSETASAAGKKSKRGVSERAKILDALFKEDRAKEVFKKLEEKALSGDLEAIKVYMAYCFGKPEGKLDITSDGEQIGGNELDKLNAQQLKNLWEIKSALGN
jgi:hypothetical protein